MINKLVKKIGNHDFYYKLMDFVLSNYSCRRCRRYASRFPSGNDAPKLL